MIDATPYSPPKGILDRVRRRIALEWPVTPINVKHPGGIISFTFDDFPKTAAQAGADVLMNNDVRGTYYAAFGLAGTDNHQGAHFDQGDIRRLSENGHEIGCHTYNHHDFAKTSVAEIQNDLARSAAALADAGAVSPIKSFT
jgi:peptidoglycan/xylan/chitin deacetylase (PgdA/CDA1 family)